MSGYGGERGSVQSIFIRYAETNEICEIWDGFLPSTRLYACFPCLAEPVYQRVAGA